MQLAGQASWRFEVGNAQFLHLALFARDAAGLAVPHSADIPPRLTPGVTPIRFQGQPAAAAEQWAAWWRELVDHQLREARMKRESSQGQDPLLRARAMGERLQKVFDPPDYASLARMPELRTAAVATFADGLRWFRSATGSSAGGSAREMFASQLVQDAATNAAADRGVPVSDLSAVVNVLQVEGAWSYLAGPGCAFCSAALRGDPAAVSIFLRGAFA
jgi:hypothetical protein